MDEELSKVLNYFLILEYLFSFSITGALAEDRTTLKHPLVPYKEREIEKKYFSIGEVADMFKVAASLIRYWEGEFDIIRPKKDKKGNRRYTQDDIQKIRYVYHLVKEKGYTLQGAQEVIAAGKKQGFDKVAAVQKLQELKDFLINLKHELHSRSNT